MSNRRPAVDERISLVCRHLALVAIEGATDEVAATLDEGFALRLDGTELPAAAYLALIAANHAAHPARPPLDVIDAVVTDDVVTVLLDGFCLARIRVDRSAIAEMSLEWDRRNWESVHRQIIDRQIVGRDGP